MMYQQRPKFSSFLTQDLLWTTIISYWNGIIAIDKKNFIKNTMILVVTFLAPSFYMNFPFNSHSKAPITPLKKLRVEGPQKNPKSIIGSPWLRVIESQCSILSTRGCYIATSGLIISKLLDVETA